MNDCCSSSFCTNNTPPKKAKCPVNGKEYSSVSPITMKHHINEPWNWEAKAQGYYFCDDPNCDVVYFGGDGSVLKQCEVRTTVGVKSNNPDRTVCYCFGVSMDQAITGEKVRSFVIQQTKEHTCACEIQNPSGKCCLNDFPKS